MPAHRMSHSGVPAPRSSIPAPPAARLGAALVVVLCAVLPFWPALFAGFSDFDDPGFLLQVEGWRGLAWHNLVWIFTTSHLGHYQPLTYLSYAIEYTLFGLNPTVMHATNIALHAVSALLLLRVLRTLAARWTGAALPTPGVLLACTIAAALWAAHPLRAEAVAWITERRDVLSLPLLLGAMLAYLRSTAPDTAPTNDRGDGARRRRRAYWLSVLLLGLSLLAKAWGITFFAVLIIMDWGVLRRLPVLPWRWLADASARRVLIDKLPFALLGVAFAAVAAHAQKTAAVDTMRPWGEWGHAERTLQACYGLVFYLWKTIAPTRLSALYELPRAMDFSQARWWICAAITLVVLGLCVWWWKKRPGVVAAIGCYVAIVAPVLGIAQSGVQLVADRYSYVAIIPIMALLAAGLWMLLERAAARRASSAPQALAAIAAILVLAAGALSWRQATLWRSTLALWEDALASGYDGPILRNYLGNQLERAGRSEEALPHYRASLEMWPANSDSWFGLANSLRTLGKYAEAEPAFRKAIEHAHDPSRAHMALGLMYVMYMQRPAEAIAQFDQARQVLEPAAARDDIARNNLGVVYLNLAAAHGTMGDEARAIDLLRKASEFENVRPQAEDLLRQLGVR